MFHDASRLAKVEGWGGCESLNLRELEFTFERCDGLCTAIKFYRMSVVCDNELAKLRRRIVQGN
jgi:hypothetical protein